jgi:hypothetical protein
MLELLDIPDRFDEEGKVKKTTKLAETTTSTRKTPVRKKKTNSPSEEEIRFRAYELFLERGGEPGFEEEDWFRAEDQLRQV